MYITLHRVLLLYILCILFKYNLKNTSLQPILIIYLSILSVNPIRKGKCNVIVWYNLKTKAVTVTINLWTIFFMLAHLSKCRILNSRFNYIALDITYQILNSTKYFKGIIPKSYLITLIHIWNLKLILLSHSWSP